jgi:hypothetical protein
LDPLSSLWLFLILASLQPAAVPVLLEARATFALRAGISTFDLSRYMGASLTMVDRHYGHLARDGREPAIRLLDELSAGQRPRWTLRGHQIPPPKSAQSTEQRLSRQKLEAL